MSLIEYQNVSFAYECLKVLENLCLHIEENSFWVVIGPNGSGKSTFLNLLANSLHPQSGDILLEGKRLTAYSSATLARKLAVVRQEFAPVFGFSVFETVLMGRFFRQKGMLFENQQDRDAVTQALDATDVLELADRPLAHLSGGERQRVYIARALAQETPILLLDEPTNHLDLKHQVKIYDLLKQMQLQSGKTIVLVSHDLNLACQYADRMLLLGKKGIAISGIPGEIMSSGDIKTIFQVSGFQGKLEHENFFIPLGQYSKDRAPLRAL